MRTRKRCGSQLRFRETAHEVRYIRLAGALARPRVASVGGQQEPEPLSLLTITEAVYHEPPMSAPLPQHGITQPTPELAP
jgi:hypothetical protein